MSSKVASKTRQIWAVLWLAVKKFFQIDGVQWAGAVAFNAFFSLFPLVILFVTIASFFIDQDKARTAVIGYAQRYVPISGDMQHYVFSTIAGVVNARGRAGTVAFLLLVWVATQCFVTLISATNRAWGCPMHNWWRLPLTSLILFGIMVATVSVGIAVPLLATMAKDWLFPVHDFRSWVYGAGRSFLLLMVVFLSLTLFYRFAPHRRTRFAEVWPGALCATGLLWAAASLFAIYLKHFATLNAVYGTFGGIMALLLWLYLSGCIVIFGVCFCAAQAERQPAGTAGH